MSSAKILTFRLGELQTNTYLIADEESRKAIILDPSDAGEYLVEKVNELRYKVEQIIATHGHFDHLLAATYLQLALKVPFFIHKRDEFLLERMQDTAKHFLGRDPGPKPTVSGYLNNKDKIKVGSIDFDIIETPGHTPGSISLLSDKEVFVGDLMFADGAVGRCDFKYSDPNLLSRSIKEILSLPKNLTIYPGHGEKTSIKKESKLRNF
jgi:glyoxylase-like metal-dependent hydrolase (beta-lactamase superfamily II)